MLNVRIVSWITQSAAVLLASVAFGCGSRGAESPSRSPSTDYPPPPAETTSGEIVGADRQTPGDKLMSGARVGSTGITPAPGAGAPKSHPTGAPSSAPPSSSPR